MEASVLVRVTEAGRQPFQLRRGEEGLSVFNLGAVDPPLTEAEILACFRPRSLVVVRSIAKIEEHGLHVIPIAGAGDLSPRLRDAHAEIRPGPDMTRAQFKQALMELE